MKNLKILLLNLFLLLTLSCEKEQLIEYQETMIENIEQEPIAAIIEVPDIQIFCLKEEYQTIDLNGQTWLAKNLNINLAGSWCAGNTPTDCGVYGRLYSFADAKKACANLGAGWRIPDKADWEALIANNGGLGAEPNSAYEELIDGGSSGFDALLRDLKLPGSTYLNTGEESSYWSGSESSGKGALFFATSYSFYSQTKAVVRNETPKNIGLSCRCVQD